MISSVSTPLPSAPEGWFVYHYFLLSDGTLAILWTDYDIRTQWLTRRSRHEVNACEEIPDVRQAQALVVILTERGTFDTMRVPLVVNPIMDRFPDGRWLITSSRAASGQSNAQILSADGQPIRSFALGDGIKYVRCAQDGTIWVGYFDEGIFGGSVASGGIVQFDDYGRPLWSYNHQGESKQSFVDDCYALTLNGAEVWTCFYSDFPIVRVKGGEERLWANTVTGSRALAVDGGVILLAGGYAGDAGRLALLRLEDGRAKLLHTLLSLEIEGANLLSGIASTIHFVTDEAWKRIRVSDVQTHMT